MNEIYILHHLGLGDHISCHGIVRYFCEQYKKVYLFVKEHNFENVRFMFNDIKNIEFIKGDDEFAQKYLSPESREIVNKNSGLLTNFVYATWNGPGWFQKFAKKINDAVKSGVTNPKELSKISIDARKNSGNSLIAQGAKKVSDIMGSNYS
jgi:hypothetical protein